MHRRCVCFPCNSFEVADWSKRCLLFAMERRCGEVVPVAIKSKDRVRIFRRKTYALLVRCGFILNRVFLYVSSEEDFESYSREFPDLNIRRAPPGVIPTVNFIISSFAANSVYTHMNDDIGGLQKYHPRAGACRDVRRVLPVLDDLLDKMNETGATMAGFYPVVNARFMHEELRRHGAYTSRLCTIMDPLVIVRNIPLTLGLTFKADWEKCILHFSHGGLLRMNSVALRADYCKAKGGIGQSRSSETEQKDAAYFWRHYPSFVFKPTFRKNGTCKLRLRSLTERPRVALRSRAAVATLAATNLRRCDARSLPWCPRPECTGRGKAIKRKGADRYLCKCCGRSFILRGAR